MEVIYTEEVIHQMRFYLSTLPERFRRGYAALESRKLGFGGISSVSRILLMDRKTIRCGCFELDGLCERPPVHRQRKVGGGRKKKLQKGVRFDRV
jgi:hypothetical protein